MLLSERARGRGALTDLAVELAAKSAGFRKSLPDGVVRALADLVRSVNCYYSNLIEGHDTHSIDIESALKKDYSKDPKKRDLQFEARAHRSRHGLMRRALMPAPQPLKAYAKCHGVSVPNFRMTFSG